MNPKVSIITPSYNQGQFIEMTILSVLKQTYDNIEYIVIDGGSTDNTMEIVNNYKNRISIIVHEKDKGQSDAINKGFKLATGELVGWINSDDTLYPDCVQEIVNLYNDNINAAIYNASQLNWIDSESKVIRTKVYNITNRQYLLNDNYDVVQPGSFYSSLYLKKINYLNEGIHFCMDLDLWLRILNYGPIISFNERPIATIRKWSGTKTSTGNVKFLKEIRKTLIVNGAKIYSSNLRRIYWSISKEYLKKLLNKI